MSFLQSALEANKEIYSLLKNSDDSSLFEYGIDENSKGAGGDRSLVIDLEAEKIFVKHLQSYGVILSEESGRIGDGEDEIVLDPIDGSSNIASNFPYYGSSVTLKKDNKPFISVIANFANGDYFVKTSEEFYEGSFDKEVTKPVTIKDTSLIGVFEKGYKDSKLAKKIKKQGFKFRVPGAVALSLGYAHRLNFVIFDGKLREYDIIGGLHMCEGLFTYVTNEIIIVSKDEKTFKKLKKSLL
ncbi:MAG: inositol monophosphatase [Campylobacterales bacterium]|nr:inositol monophosphatase [Campylobacterales bacterium]